jgi:hypothetical protein
METAMRKTLLALIAMLLAAPLLIACGDPINYEDRPLGDRLCPQVGTSTGC